MKERIKVWFYFWNINIHDYVKHHLNRFRIASSPSIDLHRSFKILTQIIHNNL